jgi:hypothetical protein
MVFVSRWHSPNGLINGATNGLVRKDREVKEKDTPGPALEDNGGGAEEGRRQICPRYRVQAHSDRDVYAAHYEAA